MLELRWSQEGWQKAQVRNWNLRGGGMVGVQDAGSRPTIPLGFTVVEIQHPDGREEVEMIHEEDEVIEGEELVHRDRAVLYGEPPPPY